VRNLIAYQVNQSTRLTVTALLIALMSGCTTRVQPTKESAMQLSHAQTLEWIQKHRAWRLAKKTRPIWARPVAPDELGKEFQTADHATEKAREGFWLCVGIAGEPWFQKPERVNARYDRTGDEVKQFAFDSQAHTYYVYRPKEGALNWVAQIKGPGISGFFVRPNYDMDHPLFSPAGGYVVMDHVPDPYQAAPNDVWLVQEPLFISTYEILP
jgi:hypothetical protein